MRTRPPAEASRRDEDGAAGEGVTEGQQSRTSVQPSCCDDGQGVGISAGAPLGAEPAGDFPEDHAGPQGTLALVVGGRDIAAGDEDKEIAAAFADATGELAAGLGGGVDGEQPVELAVESLPQRRLGSARYWVRVVSFSSGRRWPMPAARCSSLRKPGAKPVSPASIAYWASRNRWARQSWRSLPCPACAA